MDEESMVIVFFYRSFRILKSAPTYKVIKLLKEVHSTTQNFFVGLHR